MYTLPSLEAIREARRMIVNTAIRTPLVRLNIFESPAEIYLKLENLQPIGSFKIRGAANAMAHLSAEKFEKGVLTASAGNMAQGVAWCARERGIPATVIAPETATGSIDLLPILLFAIIFLWTPPHFWALSLFVRSDYAAAGVPMLPVVAGPTVTRQQIALYALATGIAAVVPWPLGLAGPVYGLAALVLSAFFLFLSLRVLANRATEPAEMKPEKRLFAYSIFYLFALFGSLVVDRWVA